MPTDYNLPLPGRVDHPHAFSCSTEGFFTSGNLAINAGFGGLSL
jgi:hypothetical protein